MKINKILIFNPFGIGDVLFSTPLLRNIKDNFPQASITYLCNRRTESMLRGNVFLDDVLVFEKDEWRALARESKIKFFKHFFSFRKKIKKKRFDIMFDLSLNSQYGLFFKLAGIKERIGFNFKKRGRFLTKKVDMPKGYWEKHVARYYLDLLLELGLKPKDYKFDLFIPEENIRRAKNIIREKGIHTGKNLIAVCPGSGDSWEKTAYYKRWPKENFKFLVEKLVKELDSQIILFGSKQESQISKSICERSNEKVLDLTGQLGLGDFTALISLCNLVITNDGGPFHIAQALKREVVGFFGPVDEKIYGPYFNINKCLIFKTEPDCRPCYNRFKFHGCNYDKKCLREIDPEDVFNSIKSTFLL